MSASAARRPLIAVALLLALASCPLVEQHIADAHPVAAVRQIAAPKPEAVALQTVLGTGLLRQRQRQVAVAPATTTAAAKAAKTTKTVATKTTKTASRTTSKVVLGADTQAGSAAEIALNFALDQLGKPYVWGAEGPDSYDCSGLTMAAYEAAGYQLPRTAADQAMVGTPVDVADLLPGDLLFYATNPSDLSTVHHVVMYAGNGMIVHAPHQGDVVRIGPMWMDDEYAGAVRIVASGPAEIAAKVSSTLKAHAKPPASSTHVTPSARPSSAPTTSPTASSTASSTGSPTNAPAAQPTRASSPSTTTSGPATAPPAPATTDPVVVTDPPFSAPTSPTQAPTQAPTPTPTPTRTPGPTPAVTPSTQPVGTDPIIVRG